MKKTRSNNLLLDKKGKIIAKDLRGGDLLKKLDELIKKYHLKVSYF